MDKIKSIPDEWKELVNDDQKRSIEHIYGPLLIIAGAGSGKTRVLTYRYAHLVKNYSISFENILAIMRKWIYQHVGFDEAGVTNDCLIVYDYLKLMGSEGISSSMQEYQVLGFQITQLHNFMVKYDVYYHFYYDCRWWFN